MVNILLKHVGWILRYVKWQTFKKEVSYLPFHGSDVIGTGLYETPFFPLYIHKDLAR